jgi:hypothetical protein
VGDRLTRPFRCFTLISLDTVLARIHMYTYSHIRRESLGFVHRSRTIFCRPVPNLSVTIRNFFIR